jgi:hypothetical protein
MRVEREPWGRERRMHSWWGIRGVDVVVVVAVVAVVAVVVLGVEEIWSGRERETAARLAGKNRSPSWPCSADDLPWAKSSGGSDRDGDNEE